MSHHLGQMPKRTLERRDPQVLRNHLLNAKIYGTTPDPEFVKLVKKHGVLEPLLITTENVIISGHKRRQAAIMAGLRSVPVIVAHGLTDALDIAEMLIVCNEQRPKSIEQRAREYQHLKEIAEKRAKALQAAAGGHKSNKKSGSEIALVSVPDTSASGQSQQGVTSTKSRSKAARQAGLGRETAAKAAEVITAIDAAEKAGDTATAKDLRETLEQNVTEAHRKIKKKRVRAATAAKKTAKPATRHMIFKPLNSAIGKAGREVDKVGELTGDEEWQALVNKLLGTALEVSLAWKGKKPWKTSVATKAELLRKEVKEWNK